MFFLPQLNLSSNRLCGVYEYWGEIKGTYTAEGVIAIAEAIEVCGALTSLDVRENRWGDGRIDAIRKAVEGREALHLKM